MYIKPERNNYGRQTINKNINYSYAEEDYM